MKRIMVPLDEATYHRIYTRGYDAGQRRERRRQAAQLVGLAMLTAMKVRV